MAGSSFSRNLENRWKRNKERKREKNIEAGGRKISYIKKPFARRSFISLGFGLAALICGAASLGISISHQGNGGLNVAGWAVSSLVFSVIGLLYGLTSFMEKEKNYILARIGIGVSGILLVFWLCLLIVGLVS